MAWTTLNNSKPDYRVFESDYFVILDRNELSVIKLIFFVIPLPFILINHLHKKTTKSLLMPNWRFWNRLLLKWYIFQMFFGGFWSVWAQFGFILGLFIPKMFYIKPVYMVYSFNISVHSKHWILWEILIIGNLACDAKYNISSNNLSKLAWWCLLRSFKCTKKNLERIWRSPYVLNVGENRTSIGLQDEF